ncbi:hypothetical protein THSYN_06120 [Candidatus Thiodictyon syntrophicum]|jgi:uncharacterized protein (DUF433 family)|uniref:DUF433 domain-containing protein n=1 Tax=Candidatus Thiodictyon syntrophicum TaxID=1166950 RepID=A0A2K8U4Q7_9GAMM|nr:hypothetical protein THSYN_06120 [Candidatus Thiodictyon syntrophicum]
MINVLDAHIEVNPGFVGGEPHIAGHRIKVRDIAVWHEQLGMSADQIGAEYDLDLAEFYSALAYYFDHREDLDRAIAAGRDYAGTLRTHLPSVLERKLNAGSHTWSAS